MSLHSSSDLSRLIEAGRMLKQARENMGLSLEDMCKKLGMRAEQIQAVEEGNTQHFKKNSQPLIWYARLYAKKLGVNLPDLVFNDIKRATAVTPVQRTIPAFLMKEAPPPKEQ